MTYEERLDQLEKRLTFLKRYNFWLWIAILVTWGGCMAFSGLNTMKANAEVEEKDSKIVTANKFRLVDKDGKIRGYWAIVDSLPELYLVGENAKAYIALTLDKNGKHLIPGLKVSNGRGHDPQITLTASPGGPSLVLWKEGIPRLLLNASNRGSSLGLLDKESNTRVLLDLERSKPAIYIKDEKDKVIWQAPEKKK